MPKFKTNSQTQTQNIFFLVVMFCCIFNVYCWPRQVQIHVKSERKKLFIFSTHSTTNGSVPFFTSVCLRALFSINNGSNRETKQAKLKHLLFMLLHKYGNIHIFYWRDFSVYAPPETWLNTKHALKQSSVMEIFEFKLRAYHVQTEYVHSYRFFGKLLHENIELFQHFPSIMEMLHAKN